MGAEPTISVGMPVFNGQEYLEPAIRSILDQSFVDFELIIADNASTDATADICREFERLDSRITYVRNPQNLGADPNYNLVFGKARGRFFKWAAHDDVIAPDFLGECLATLEREPDAVLCQSLVRVIDPEGRDIGSYDSELRGAASTRASDRFASLVLNPHWCTEIFGVIRADALSRTNLHGGFHHSDRILLAELALLGRFVQVPAPLFLSREHPSRYIRAIRGSERAAWHDSSRSPALDFSTWHMLREYWRIVPKHVEDPSERARCRAQLGRWFFTNWNVLRLATDPLVALDPRFERWRAKVKNWI